MNDRTRHILRFLKTFLRFNVLDPVEETLDRARTSRQNRPANRRDYARDLTEYIEGPTQALRRRKEPT